MPIKTLGLILKDLNLQSREAVIAHATYKTLDREQDLANRGMFDKSWKEGFHDLRYFFNHEKKQAPGKPIRAWDDDDHAYTQVKHGTHTLGEDTLKMLDEGTIVAASYGFIPIKQKKLQNKGLSFMEVKHMETSVLTHWGAHEESGLVQVKKAMETMEMDQIFTWMKNMEKFIRNTSASDDAIQGVEKQLKALKQLLNKHTDTAGSTEPALVECPKCHTMSSGIVDAQGRTKCAECEAPLTIKEGQPAASSDKDAFRRRLLLLKHQMSN